MAFYDLTSEVTQGHYLQILLVEVVTTPQIQEERT